MSAPSLKTASILEAEKKMGIQRTAKIPSLSTIFSTLIIIIIILALLTGETYRFYASALFLFYSLTKRMWISVICLGIFQTILMIPLRIINLLKSAHIKEFQEKLDEIEKKDQYFVLKKKIRKGERVALFYIVNFLLQTISYFSIGRLFLIDFYTKRLSPKLLYSFVPYPDYPIRERIFRIPYVWFTKTIDLGMDKVLIVWAVLFALQIAVYVAIYIYKKFIKTPPQDTPQTKLLRKVGRYTSGYLVLFFFLSWLLIRHLPLGWEFRIFSGDVSIPNRTLNFITAVATFITLVWLNIPKIEKKEKLARAAKIPEEIIFQTQKDMLKETLRNATIVGLGAYYITNYIPAAFELSIFTLEIISWLSPFTLDRIILSTTKNSKSQLKDLTKKEKQNEEDKLSGTYKKEKSRKQASKQKRL
jgi:hypothetical protein